ncbi:hypothetical protein Droror1_Dr00014742 [Drosera rotundifolia]
METAKRVDFDLDRNDAVDSMGSVDGSGSVSERAFSAVIVNPLDIAKAVFELELRNGAGVGEEERVAAEERGVDSALRSLRVSVSVLDRLRSVCYNRMVEFFMIVL